MFSQIETSNRQYTIKGQRQLEMGDLTVAKLKTLKLQYFYFQLLFKGYKSRKVKKLAQVRIKEGKGNRICLTEEAKA